MRDFMDVYLQEIDQGNYSKTDFNENALLVTAMDLFSAGGKLYYYKNQYKHRQIPNMASFPIIVLLDSKNLLEFINILDKKNKRIISL